MTSPDEPAGAGELRRDARDLRRGVAINALGYLARVAYPVLLGVAVALYGAAEFGVFTAAQAALLLVLRLALLGLDKGVLWWVPRQAAGAERRGLRPVLSRSSSPAPWPPWSSAWSWRRCSPAGAADRRPPSGSAGWRPAWCPWR